MPQNVKFKIELLLRRFLVSHREQFLLRLHELVMLVVVILGLLGVSDDLEVVRPLVGARLLLLLQKAVGLAGQMAQGLRNGHHKLLA